MKLSHCLMASLKIADLPDLDKASLCSLYGLMWASSIQALKIENDAFNNDLSSVTLVNKTLFLLVVGSEKVDTLRRSGSFDL